MTLSARTDRTLVRTAGRSVRYVLLQLVAPALERITDRPPVHLAFVVDRSGSMAGQKIALAKRAVEDGIMRLDATDRFAVVSYDQQIDVVIDSTTATAEAKQMALARLRAIDARGSTDLAEGWLRGCEQVALGLTDDAIGRCLLLTDGLANVGIKDPAILRTHATELRARRITTTTFGVGTDFDEVLLQSMADAGAGHYYYIDSVARIPDFMASEVGEALETVARDAVIAAHTPDVLVEPIGPLAFTRAGDATLVHLDDLVSGQVLEVVLKLTFPVGTDGAERQVAFRLADRDGVLGGASATISWRYASHAENDAQPRDRLVDARVAAVYAARAREEALALNRDGRFDEASRALSGVARRISDYAGDDPGLRALSAQLAAERQVFAAPMAVADRKARYFASTSSARSRDAQGRAFRSES